MTEPEHSCPFSSPMWELAPLSRHYHPYVATHAKHVSAGAPSAGPGALPVTHSRATPKDLYNAFDPAEHGFSFNPPMKEPVSHPLAKQKSKKEPEGTAAAPKVLRRIGQFKMIGIRDGELQAYVENARLCNRQRFELGGTDESLLVYLPFPCISILCIYRRCPACVLLVLCCRVLKQK